MAIAISVPPRPAQRRYEKNNPFVAPVIYPARGDPQWSALNFSVTKELRRVAAENGLGSHYFAGLLESVCEGHVFTPYDLKTLARLLLNPSQYALWESNWKHGVEKLTQRCAAGDNPALQALTVDHLMGAGQFTDPAAQAREIPRNSLLDTTQEAKRAFLKIPDASKPQKAFTSIIQGPKEPYMEFISKLQQALEKQIDNVDARNILLLKLAVENANADCKRLLKSLPRSDPTLVEMMQACNCFGTPDYKYETTAAAFASMQGPGHKFKNAPVCYGCGQVGHLKKNCQNKKNLQNIPMCSKCKKGRHLISHCHSKFDNQGQPLQPQGNLSHAARRHKFLCRFKPHRLSSFFKHTRCSNIQRSIRHSK
ncbi:endogenous retrovirus group K member 9 Gag polyprotein-like [Heliangelus exortis]|uniref:endogenous retrovirus group K member 9 Gag polyprotein-like n=1 Tax=Heliangelus exortis TaxID=472823 RepID=UPI003A90A29A